MTKHSILIVEDEAIVAEDLASKIQQLGYDVAGITGTGEEAIELAHQQRPALVLMDISLAGAMDGIAAAQVIQSDCNLPVLFVTAHSDTTTVERAQQANAFGYILKPFDERDLRIQIEMAVYKNAAEQRLRESEQRHRFALETARIGAWDLDLVDYRAFRSIEHDHIFGYPELLQEWTYEMFLEHVLPEDRAMVDGKFQRAVESQGDWNFECRILRADGELRWIWGAGRYHQYSVGTARRMAGIVQDVTER
jgi:PAS domain S-box-containing protein